MSYRTFITEVLVTCGFLETAAVDTNDYIKRKLAIKAVEKLPLADLEKIFEFSKITGEDQINPFEPSDRRFKIAEMRINRTELNIAKIKIPY